MDIILAILITISTLVSLIPKAFWTLLIIITCFYYTLSIFDKVSLIKNKRLNENIARTREFDLLLWKIDQSIESARRCGFRTEQIYVDRRLELTGNPRMIYDFSCSLAGSWFLDTGTIAPYLASRTRTLTLQMKVEDGCISLSDSYELSEYCFRVKWSLAYRDVQLDEVLTELALSEIIKCELGKN